MKALCLSAVAWLLTTASLAQGQALEDWTRLHQLFEVYNGSFSSEYARSEKGPEFIQEWKSWSEEAPEFIGHFKETYGDTPEAVAKAFEGMDAPENVYSTPETLAEALYAIDFQALGAEVAGWLAKVGDEQYQKWESYDAPPEKMELKLKYAERALSSYEAASEIDPSAVADRLAKAQEAVEVSKSEWMDTLKTLEWPGHNPSFAGPGNPDDLAAAALSFLEDLKAAGKTWSKPEYDDEHIPLAACVVASDWGIEKRNPVTQSPTQYRLKMFVAFDGTKDDDIAYCYYMYFYTGEGEGVEKTPPFQYCNSEQYASYRMLKENIAKADGVTFSSEGAKAVGGASSGGGFLTRLLVGLMLIVGGLTASSGQMLSGKMAFLKSPCATLEGKRKQVALVLLLIGAVSVLFALLRFAIFANLLPHVAALALGLALLTPLSAQADEEKKSQSILNKWSGALAPFETPLGLIALCLGVIHILMGGFVLV